MKVKTNPSYLTSNSEDQTKQLSLSPRIPPQISSSNRFIIVKIDTLAITRRNTEATHALAQRVVIPVIRCNSNLVAAGAVAVDAKNAIRPQVVFPVNGVTALAGGLGAALVFFPVPLPAAGSEDPGVGHGEDGGDGSDSGGGELHILTSWKSGLNGGMG